MPGVCRPRPLNGFQPLRGVQAVNLVDGASGGSKRGHVLCKSLRPSMFTPKRGGNQWKLSLKANMEAESIQTVES